MRSIFVVTTLGLAAPTAGGAPAAGVAAPTMGAAPRVPGDALRAAFKHGPRGGAPGPGGPPRAGAGPAAPPHGAEGWDVTHYVLDVHIDPDAASVTGRAVISATRTGEGPLVLHAREPTITATWMDGEPTAAQWADGELRFEPRGGTTTVVVAWTYDQANPTGIQWGDDTIYSFHEPNGARTWLPVHDHPADKATLDWVVTAPDGWTVAANGTLLGTEAADGWTTWRYAMTEPIATYLMAVHLADYVVTELDGDVPVQLWVYPGREAEALESFGDTPQMLAFYESIWGAYPFDGYGIAMAPFPTAMEHTTCVTFSDVLVGSGAAGQVNAHELAHHWWGNDVTLGEWSDIWLNEGFATYGELLWYEHQHGPEGRVAYAAALRDAFFDWQDLEGEFPVYDPVYMWGGVVYDKGAYVVHMLRWVLGDEAFFEGLAEYRARHGRSNAVTADLQAALEATSGSELGWFFDQWVYAAGEPTYSYGWEVTPAGQGWQLDLAVRADLSDHRMPVPLRVTYADGAIEDVVIDVVGEGDAALCVDREPVAVTLDPEGWVLRKREVEVEVTPAAEVCVAPPEGCGCDAGDARMGAGILALSALLLRRRRG